MPFKAVLRLKWPRRGLRRRFSRPTRHALQKDLSSIIFSLAAVEDDPLLRGDRYLELSIDRTNFLPRTCTRWPSGRRRPFDHRNRDQRRRKRAVPRYCTGDLLLISPPIDGAPADPKKLFVPKPKKIKSEFDRSIFL